VSRQADCGIPEARARAKIARKYLEMAELAQTEDLSEAKNVAAGNAVLAGSPPPPPSAAPGSAAATEAKTTSAPSPCCAPSTPKAANSPMP
jgi:hypothetical protein